MSSRIRTGLGLRDGGVTLRRLPPWNNGTSLLERERSLLKPLGGGESPPRHVVSYNEKGESPMPLEEQGEHT